MKTKILTSVLVGFLVISIVATTTSIAANDKANEKARAPDLEKVEFIHWRKGFGKPGCECDNDGKCEPEEGEHPSCCDDCKGGGEEKPTTTCYAFMGKYGKKYLKWRELPVSYVINPANPAGLPEDFVTGAISAGAEEWDYYAVPEPEELFNDEYAVDYFVTYGIQDYKNAFSFGDYPTEGVIAVTTVWYNPATKTIVEFDVMFDRDWVWGDATDDPTVMDLENIAVHELGHGVGLDDVYEAECSAVTMYGYSEYGETQKRDLAEPDIIGILELYPE